MQFVLEFGSNRARPVLEAIKRVFVDSLYDVQSLDASGRTASTDTLESAEPRLEKGEVSSLSFYPRQGLIRYALVLGPHFEGSDLSDFLGTIEYTGLDYSAIWNSLLADPDLTFACVGDEEGVELSDSQLSTQTFPWDRWPLIIGALRDPADPKAWIVRPGPVGPSGTSSKS